MTAQNDIDEVTVVIPTKNAGSMLENCLMSIAGQTYPHVTVFVVDGGSTDATLTIAQKYNAKLLKFTPDVARGIFDAPHKRNYGVKYAQAPYVYYVDADMELQPDVIQEAVSLCKAECDAVIVPEDSYGVGIWARAKNLERRCYWGDNSVEAPRFFKKIVWDRLGGLDESVGGNDDWDMYRKLIDNGYSVGRTQSIVRHNEGNLTLGKLYRKRFMYGRHAIQYIAKRPRAGTASYFPIRKAYLRNWRLFLSRPIDTAAFVVMRSSEYTGGLLGILYSLTKR